MRTATADQQPRFCFYLDATEHSCGHQLRSLLFEFEDVGADELANLDLNSVAESGQSGSLHPCGSPSIHSSKSAERLGRRSDHLFPAADAGFVAAPLHRYSKSPSVSCGDRGFGDVDCRLPFPSPLTGVGNSFTRAGSEGRTAAPLLGDWLLP